MRRRGVLLAVISVSWSLSVFANRTEMIEAFEIRGAQRARSAEELNHHLVRVREFKISQKACELQIQMRELPTSCYEANRRGRELGINERAIPKQKWIDSICVQISKTTEETSLRVLKKLNGRCARVVAPQIRINRYKAGMDIE